MPVRPIAALALVALLLSPSPAADPPGGDFFLPTKVWEFHLTIPAKEFAAMQPPAGAMPMFGAPPRPPAPKPKAGEDTREVHRNTFGVDLPWARGTFAAEGKAFDDIGLRYKGNGTFLESGQSLKKSFKIDLDRHVAAHRYRGLKTLNLHSGVADPSRCRETLAYAIYRNCGVPSPRTTLAEVTLTVPGKYDKELLGLYTVVEQVDSAFLRTHFQTDKGLLMKPERMPGLDHHGDDWARYAATYLPKRDATPAEQKRLIAFTRLVNRADDDAFNREIGTYLDVDGFLRFMAVTALAVSLDSFFTLGHNYYLYLHPETHKFHFFPWDLDRSLANFGIFGTNDQQMDLSVTQPYTGPQRLADRVMAMKGDGRAGGKPSAGPRSPAGAQGGWSRTANGRGDRLMDPLLTQMHPGGSASAPRGVFSHQGRPPAIRFLTRALSLIAILAWACGVAAAPAPLTPVSHKVMGSEGPKRTAVTFLLPKPWHVKKN